MKSRATRDPRPSTCRNDGAKFDTPRAFGTPPAWSDEPQAYPGERRFLKWANGHPNAVVVMACSAVAAFWLLFVSVFAR